MEAGLVEWNEYAVAKRELGDAFVRILGYFREDGFKSVEAIENAMAANDAAALVIPAHTLKGESRQFGAKLVGDMSETIEMTARDCIEKRIAPAELKSVVANLRASFTRTLGALEGGAGQGVTPAAARKPGVFGRKAPGAIPSFGRA
jgi:histidine phosphotransfer protein HptB